MTEENSTSTGQAGGVPSQESQTTEQPKEKSFSQADLNAARAEEKREWQAKLKELKSKADEWDKLQEASKSELEKLTGERDTFRTEAQKATLEAAKLRALMKAGADPEKIDALIKRVVGSTSEEIEADVAELQGLGLLGPAPKQSQQATGAGNPGVKPNSEPSIDDRIAELEKAARTDPNVRPHLTSLKLKKQAGLFK